MKRNAWLLLCIFLLSLYYLSSVPGLRVLPVLRQINAILRGVDIRVTWLAEWIAVQLPHELGPVRTVTEDFLAYAQNNPLIIEFLLRKVAHVAFFFFLTLVIYLLLRHYIRRTWLAILTTFVLSSLVGVLDEYHQSFVPGRFASPIDVAINLVGIILGIGLIIFAHFITTPQRPEETPE